MWGRYSHVTAVAWLSLSWFPKKKDDHHLFQLLLSPYRYQEKLVRLHLLPLLPLESSSRWWSGFNSFSPSRAFLFRLPLASQWSSRTSSRIRIGATNMAIQRISLGGLCQWVSLFCLAFSKKSMMNQNMAKRGVLTMASFLGEWLDSSPFAQVGIDTVELRSMEKLMIMQWLLEGYPFLYRSFKRMYVYRSGRLALRWYPLCEFSATWFLAFGVLNVYRLAMTSLLWRKSGHWNPSISTQCWRCLSFKTPRVGSCLSLQNSKSEAISSVNLICPEMHNIWRGN